MIHHSVPYNRPDFSKGGEAMIRKLLVGMGVVFVAAVFLLGRETASYVRTSLAYVKDSVRQGVPIEFQIERARRMIDELVPEIRNNMHRIAKEEVEIQRLEERIALAEKNLEKEKQEILRLKEDLARGRTSYTYAGRTYSVEEVKTDLAHRFERYKTSEATLASLREIHQARTKSLQAARQRLEGMLAARRQLTVEVENLEAQRQMIDVAKTSSNYVFDESKLGQVKQLIQQLRTQLDTEAKLVQAETQLQDQIPLEKPASENILEEVSEYFALAGTQP